MGLSPAVILPAPAPTPIPIGTLIPGIVPAGILVGIVGGAPGTGTVPPPSPGCVGAVIVFIPSITPGIARR